MDYLLKASGLVILHFLFYYTFLKNETFFKSIRGYFLIGLILVLTIPLIEIPIYAEQVVSQLNSLNYSDLSIENLNVDQNSFNWIQLATIIYILGVGIFTLKFLIQLISLGKLLSKHKFIKQSNYYFVETSKSVSPFSFFNIIIYNKTQFTIDELEQIINHEKAHVLQWHSIDTILAHLLVITLWFNPFVWLFKKAVQQNLEFLADEYALELAQNQQRYQFALLKTCSQTYCTSITNNFYNSLIKKRIIMLQKNRSTKKSQWKYALLFPILVAFILSFNTKIIAQEKKLIEVEEIDKLKVELIIDKNSTEETIKKEVQLFKKQFDIEISFKGIKRNSQNEITSIKIEAISNNSTTKFENSGSEPIKPIKISYDSENDAISIGNVNELHEKHITYKIKKGYNIEVEPNLEEKEQILFFSNDGKDSEEKVWIQENGNDKKIVIKILDEEDNAHENVFMFKSDSDNNETVKEGKKSTIILKSAGDLKPLFYIDGEKATSKEMEAINPDTIESINVLKDNSAIKKYGEKGKNGVVEITTKRD
tara:strand:- start:8874 stop:10487 length:1614 start_codon:yes stop_codon:yes gene_type:complete